MRESPVQLAKRLTIPYQLFQTTEKEVSDWDDPARLPDDPLQGGATPIGTRPGGRSGGEGGRERGKTNY